MRKCGNFGILFALAFVSFTVKNTPDLVKISVKTIRFPRSVVSPDLI